MKFGYARVSTQDQNLELQTNALKEAGATKIFKDRISGAKAERPELSALLGQLREGDTVIVWRLDRLARSLQHLIELASDFNARGVQLRSLKENIDTTSSSGKLFFHIFGAIAEFERDLNRERTNAGLSAAKARGVRVGRKKIITGQKAAAVALLFEKAQENGESPNFNHIGNAIGADRRTVRRFYNDEYAPAAKA